MGHTAKIVKEVKKDAVANLFKPASAIVNEVLLEEMTDAPYPSLPNPANLARAANYLRQKMRPTDLDFVLEEQHIPANFLRKDIKVSNFVVLKCINELCMVTIYL